MEKKKKKNIKNICLASGAVTVALGASSAGIVYAVNNQEVSNYKLSMNNVYSIRDFTLHAYNQYLSNAGMSTASIAKKLDQVKGDIDTIIKNGQAGGFSVDHIYTAVSTYAKGCQINLVDWQMMEDFINVSLSKLKSTINQTNLPKEKKEEIYNKYSNSLKAKVTDIKKHAASSAEAFTLLKNYSNNLAQEELSEQADILIKFFATDFFNSHKFYLNDYWDEADTWLSSLATGAEFDLSHIFADKTEGMDNDPVFINNFSGVLSSDTLINIYKDNNYKLKANFVRRDNAQQAVVINFTVTDMDNNITWTSDNFVVQAIFSPEYYHQKVVELTQQYQLSLNHLTMQDWVNLAASYKGYSTDNFPSQPINDSTFDSYDTPMFVDEGLNASMAFFKVNGSDSLKDPKYEKLLKDVLFCLYVYAIDTNSNKVIYRVTATHNYGTNGQVYNEDEEKYETMITPPVIIHERSTADTFSATDLATTAQLQEHLDGIKKTLKQANDKTLENINRLYITNSVLAAEQSAMAVVCSVFAGIYFAAAPETLGITTPFGVLATIGAAGCIAGAAVSSVCAVGYKQQYDFVKGIRSSPDYPQFELQSEEFIKSAEGKAIASGTLTHLPYQEFAHITNRFNTLVRTFSTVLYGHDVQQAVAAATASATLPSIVAQEINTFGQFYSQLGDCSLTPMLTFDWWLSLRAYVNAEGVPTVMNNTRTICTFPAFAQRMSTVLVDHPGYTLQQFITAGTQYFIASGLQGSLADDVGAWEDIGEPLCRAIFERRTNLQDLHAFWVRLGSGRSVPQDNEIGAIMTNLFRRMTRADIQELPVFIAHHERFATEVRELGSRFVGYARRIQVIQQEGLEVAQAAGEFGGGAISQLAFDTEEEFRLFCRDYAIIAADVTTWRGTGAANTQFGGFWREGADALISSGARDASPLGNSLQTRLYQALDLSREEGGGYDLARAPSYAAARDIGGRVVEDWLVEQGVVARTAAGNIVPLANGRFGISWAHQQEFNVTQPLIRARGLIEGVQEASVLPCAQTIRTGVGQVFPATGAVGSQTTTGVDVLALGPMAEGNAARLAAAAYVREVTSNVLLLTIQEKYGGPLHWFSLIRASRMAAELKHILTTEEAAAAIYRPIVYTAIVSVPPVEAILGLIDLGLNIVGIVLQSVWS